MAGTVVIFDFDRTIIDDDSDRWVVTEMGLTILFRELLGTMPWNSLMDRMMMELHSNGKTTNEIAECLGRAPLHPRIIAAIKSAHALGCDLKVVSDANQFFIETILKHHGILGCFSEIISNPTVVDEEGRLKIFPYHDFTSSPHGCNLCPFNMCKIDNNKNIESPVKENPRSHLHLLRRISTPSLPSKPHFGGHRSHIHLRSHLSFQQIETISHLNSDNIKVIFLPQILTVVTMSLRKPPLPRILLNNVSCMRNAQQILRHVNVSVHDGGALILTGTNGSGKSTFLRMMAGFSKPSAGEILWNGHNITESGVFHQYKLQLNWLSLKDAIKEKFTVLDNVQWFELLEGKYGKSLPALELMGLGRLAKDKARLLSMGQRKRVQLARLLAMDRQIWLLDEPSVALDDEGVRLLEYIIAEHRKKGGIVFVATHLPIKIEDAMYLRLPPRFPRRMTLVDMLDRGD